VDSAPWPSGWLSWRSTVAIGPATIVAPSMLEIFIGS
jgi:hypothetical protein